MFDFRTTNPLTGDSLEIPAVVGDNYINYYDSNLPLGKFAITVATLREGFYWGGQFDLDDSTLSVNDTKRLLSLAQSKSWLANQLGYKQPLFLQEQWFKNFSNPRYSFQFYFEDHQIMSVESLWQELQGLSIRRKSLRTLENLSAIEATIGAGIQLAYAFDPYPGFLLPKQEGVSLLGGIVYGCVPSEIPIIMQSLLEQGFVVPSTLNQKTYITPAGYEAIESVRRVNSKDPSTAFLVCRFKDNMDKFFEDAYATVGRDDGFPCTIIRIKDIAHNDRIDDRILMEIRKSQIVIVDLTEDNFNIGFEAGYALSQEKPIVWTMKQPTGDLKLPFDIQSHNILLWREDNLDEFLDQLKARMSVALERASDMDRGPLFRR